MKVKFIHWRNDMAKNGEGHCFANVHYLVGYNQSSITDLQQMAAVIRETFPQATDDQIIAGKVTVSGSYKNFTLVAWNAHIPEGEYPGWTQDDNPSYNWQ
jgi:hypothetical protein